MALPLLMFAFAGILSVAGAAWEAIVHWLSDTVATFIGDALGPQMKSMFLDVVTRADRAAVAAKSAIKSAFVKADVLITNVVGGVRRQSVAYLRSPTNPATAIRRTVTENVSIHSLPPDLQAKLQARQEVHGSMTMRNIG